ncbi:MAG: hemerythrin [Sphingobacteriia bacterium]|nr:hemerythrin [Sphingobacteriia bacterium]NCC38649.1 hemerythrin [Gammaproteobacteria bacterium]
MTVLMAWRDDWAVQIDEVDAEHRALVEQLAAICARFDATARPALSTESRALIDALSELGESTRQHFKREEELMESIGYAEIAAHRTEHAMLMAEYADLIRQWQAEGLSRLDEAAQESVRDWILDHILGADRDFAQAVISSSQPPEDGDR